MPAETVPSQVAYVGLSARVPPLHTLVIRRREAEKEFTSILMDTVEGPRAPAVKQEVHHSSLTRATD